MKKKIKLRDLTKEEWDKNKYSLCNSLSNACCDNCIFQWVGGCLDSIYRNSWVNHKDCYSDKFLDQEVEIEIENKELLDEEDRKYLTNMYNLINVRNYEIYTICKCVDSFLGKKIGFISITFESNVEDYGCERLCGPLFNPEERFKNLEIDKGYRLEELGL